MELCFTGCASIALLTVEVYVDFDLFMLLVPVVLC